MCVCVCVFVCVYLYSYWHLKWRRCTGNRIFDSWTDVLVKVSIFFQTENVIGPRGTQTPNLRIHAECSNRLSYRGQTYSYLFWNAGSGGIDIFVCKVDMWYVNSVQATAVILDSRADVLVKSVEVFLDSNGPVSTTLPQIINIESGIYMFITKHNNIDLSFYNRKFIS